MSWKDHENENCVKNHSKGAEFPFIPLYINGQLSEDELKQQIEVMLIAGHGTTGLTIAYAILMLAMYPNLQEQVFEEVYSVFDTQDEDIILKHIQKLHLLDRVIKETMRIFPPAPLIQRTCNKDIPISNCVIPKNTLINISIYTLQQVR